MNDELTVTISEMLAPWAVQLGDSRVGYTNHVVRVLMFADELHALTGEDSPRPSDRLDFLATGVFHDLGIWNDGTFDYLAPSIDLARDWLDARGNADLIPLVTEMIDQHHKVRAWSDELNPVEIFRRADTIDVSLGLRRFGVSHRNYRKISKAYPDHGFHWGLVKLSARRLVEHPSSPLPMFRW